jgi:hypothetical protein
LGENLFVVALNVNETEFPVCPATVSALCELFKSAGNSQQLIFAYAGINTLVCACNFEDIFRQKNNLFGLWYLPVFVCPNICNAAMLGQSQYFNQP